MEKKRSARQEAIIRRRIFLGICACVLVLIVALIVFIVSAIVSDGTKDNSTVTESLQSDVSSEENSVSSENNSSYEDSSAPDTVTLGEYTLDAKYSNLLLVNGEKPLPENYDYEGNLTTIPQKYIKGSLTQFDKDAWPYLQAMLDAARSENIDIGVWSPYRSYSTQNMLFENRVKKCMNSGLDRAAAEIEAATVVARPGTSEHNTGLALDINCADDSFESTAAYKWLTENAADYGFIMRYRKDKQPLTGVIHESWHWRFVGINVAKEINKLDMCLEEYVDYLEKQKKSN